MKGTVKSFGQLIGSGSKFNDPIVFNQADVKRKKKKGEEDKDVKKGKQAGSRDAESVGGFLIEVESKRKLRLVQEHKRSVRVADSEGDASKGQASGDKRSYFSARNREREQRPEYLTKRPGESISVYGDRVDRHTRELMTQKVRKNTKAAQRKKQFFEKRREKKKKKKDRKLQPSNQEEQDDDLASDNDMKRKQEKISKPEIETRRVGVHDVVVKPPEFNFSKKRFKQFSHKYGL